MLTVLLLPSMALPSLPTLSHQEVKRYSRHLILDQFGTHAQRTLKKSKILCVGSGGLGSPAITYLAALGVGTIGIVDDDLVDESNLQRQILHSTQAINTPKVDSAQNRINEINPFVNVVSHKVRLSASNALDILRGYDIIIDGSDNFPTRYLVNDACEILGIPFVYGAVQKFEGQVSLFNFEGGPTYRDLFPDPPPPGSIPSCAEGGILGVLPGVIGTIQATEAIKALLRLGDSLSGRLLIYDAMRMRFHEVKLLSRPDREPIRGLIDYYGFCGQSKDDGEAVADSIASTEPFTRVEVQRVHDLLSSGAWKPFVLDVRTAAECDIVSLSFTDKQYPHRQVEHLVPDLLSVAMERDILVLCKGGVRSDAACVTLAAAGVSRERLFSLQGGITAWAQQIDSSLPTY